MCIWFSLLAWPNFCRPLFLWNSVTFVCEWLSLMLFSPVVSPHQGSPSFRAPFRSWPCRYVLTVLDIYSSQSDERRPPRAVSFFPLEQFIGAHSKMTVSMYQSSWRANIVWFTVVIVFLYNFHLQLYVGISDSNLCIMQRSLCYRAQFLAFPWNKPENFWIFTQCVLLETGKFMP